MGKRAVWAVHAGQEGDAEGLFLERHCIALGWPKTGDLSGLAKDRGAFKEAIAGAYGSLKATTVPRSAGQLFRFIHEVSRGDLVVYPSSRDQKIRLGEIVGDYAFSSDGHPGFPHRRAVKWMGTVPRAEFAPAALGEIDLPFALSQVSRHVSDFVSKLSNGWTPDDFAGDEDASSEEERELAPLDDVVAYDTPRALFRDVRYDVSSLLNSIDIGDIGLPDIQRPFVWSAGKVRDLFDSMFRGFPVGYLLFWSNTDLAREGGRAIGSNEKQRRIPSLLVVDGQQRLTSLYAVFKGRSVLDNEFKQTRIEIAFRPRDGRFEVTDAAKRNDPEFIPNISEIWASDRPSWRIVNDYLEQLQKRRQLTERDKDAIGKNLDRLFDLQKYPFTALEIASSVDEESVANIFVRINSDGVKLNQADFILTLLSVFWDEGRAALESFSRASRVPALPGQPSPFNYFLQPSPDQLLRVSVAYGFHRGRLKSVYHLLRGKDLETGRVTEAQRDAQFAKLREAQGQVLHLTNWKLFLDCLVGAGFRSGQEISSSNSLLFAYAFFLIGRLQCGVEVHTLQRLIGRWFFATTLTGRYTSSPETDVEADLVRIREVREPAAFIEALERIIAGTLTNDFWTITLPTSLESATGRSPALFAFYASQNRLGAPVLFSDRKISDLLDPTVRGPKKSLERHHLFPRDWLEDNGVTDLKQINQLGNLTLMEWPDNIAVGASPPREYVPELRKRFSTAAWERMSRLHALPPGWEEMAYGTFLQQRRALMAALIRRGFESLSLTPTEDDTLIDGTPDERTVWALIESAELSLRAFVDARYRERWGQAAEGQIRKLLGEDAVKVLERNREKHVGQYPLAPAAAARPIIDYTYLGQLGQLMLVNDGWQLFRFSPRRRTAARAS